LETDNNRAAEAGAANKNLGRLVAIYGISAAYQQRAVFVAVLSFVFFVAMMIGYYIREYVGYFLLASAFLVLYLVMMFSWFWHRKNVVEVFENGFRYRKDDVSWDQIESISDDLRITTKNARTIALPRALEDFEDLIAKIGSRSKHPTD